MQRMTAIEYLNATPIPSESIEQQRLFQWARMMQGKHPELEMLFKISNEGKRTRTNGARMRAEGLKKGVPDLCLPVARCGCHALYIELKKADGGRLSSEQIEWLDRLKQQGNMAVVSHGWEPAAQIIEDYLEGRL